MPRLPNLTNRDEVPDELRPAYDQIAGDRGGSVSGPYGVLLHSPEVALRLAQFGNYVRFDSVLNQAQREIVTMAIAREMDAAVMWAGHAYGGLRAGVRQEVVDVVGHRGDLATLTDEERDLVSYVRGIFNDHRPSDATYAALHARFGDRGIVDLVGLVGYYSCVGIALNTFDVEAPPRSMQLP